MMNFGNNRNQLFLINIVAVLLVLFTFSALYNIIQKQGNLSIFPFILLILYLGVQFFFLKKTVELTDSNALDKIIKERVEAETIKIELKYIEQEAKKTEQEKQKKASQEQIENLLPKGNFKKVDTYCNKLLENISNGTEAIQGIFYLLNKETDTYQPVSGFATELDTINNIFEKGDGLAGQVAESCDIIQVEDIPEEYSTIKSGLGEAKISSLYITPFYLDDNSLGVAELGYYKNLSADQLELLKKVGEVAGKKIYELINS